MNASQRKRFEEDLARIVRRANRLRAAIDGSADVVVVQVRQCEVAKHTRGAHTRTVIKLRKGK